MKPSEKRKQTIARLKKEAQEERAKNLLVSDLYNLKKRLNSKSIYSFSVGDKVKGRTVHWKSVEILKIEEDKYFLCKVSFSKETSSGPKAHEEIMWLNSLDIMPENVKEESNFVKDPLRLSHMATDMSSLLRYHFNGDVNYNPPYQRDLVWDLKDKELLIDSVFKGVSIGAFAFVKLDFSSLKENEPYLEILDGKQRLTTLAEFYADGFKYRGKYFSEMSKSDKRYFMASLVSLGMASNLSEKEKIRYFLDLNTKGRPQSEDHLNKVRKLLD